MTANTKAIGAPTVDLKATRVLFGLNAADFHFVDLQAGSSGAIQTANANAIQAAIDALPRGTTLNMTGSPMAYIVKTKAGGAVNLPNGVYEVAPDIITLYPGVRLKGQSRWGTTLMFVGAGKCIQNDATVSGVAGTQGWSLEDIFLYGDGATAQEALYFTGGSDLFLQNVWMFNFLTTGLHGLFCQWSSFHNVIAMACGQGVLLEEDVSGNPCNNNHFYGLRVLQCTNGMQLSGHANGIHGGTCQFNTASSLLVATGTGGAVTLANVIEGVHFEGHTGLFDVDVQASVRGTVIENCFFVNTSDKAQNGSVYPRLVRNLGDGTTIINPTTPAGAINLNGSKALAEQNTGASGYLSIFGGRYSDGSVTPEQWVCDEAGSVTSTIMRHKVLVRAQVDDGVQGQGKMYMWASSASDASLQWKVQGETNPRIQFVGSALQMGTGGGALAQVLGTRKTGWTTVPTGTPVRTTFATYAAPTVTNPPTQAEVQAIADHLQIVSARLAALIIDLSSHGAIGP